MNTKMLILFFPIMAFAAGPGEAEFRGYVRTNNLLRERLFKPGSDFELGAYVGQHYAGYGTNLLDLLGTQKNGFAGGRFRNGIPNSLNMLIWHMLFTRLSADVAHLCAGSANLDFNASFASAVLPLCGFPIGQAVWDERLFQLWLKVIAFDAPLAEFEAWRAFWTSSAAAGLSGPEAVEWMMLSLFNNPYFLLRL
jgi:hypothetical protein